MNWRLALQGSCFPIRLDLFCLSTMATGIISQMTSHTFISERASKSCCLVLVSQGKWHHLDKGNSICLGAVSPSYPSGLSKVSSPFQEHSSCFPFFWSAWLSSFKLCSLYPAEQAANLQVLWSCCSALKKKTKKNKNKNFLKGKCFLAESLEFRKPPNIFFNLFCRSTRHA